MIDVIHLDAKKPDSLSERGVGCSRQDYERYLSSFLGSTWRAETDVVSTKAQNCDGDCVSVSQAETTDSGR